MREIKFRGWHTVANKMFSAAEMGTDQLTIMPDGRGFVNVSGTDTRLSQFPKMIPLQYTGLKDKNGKEIYEGDILKYWEGKLYQIGYLAGSFVAYSIPSEIDCPHTQTGIWLYELDDMDNREVIGNIYEHNYLLEGGKK